jgi:DNA-binding LacI/PurR family transcriptional regulator
MQPESVSGQSTPTPNRLSHHGVIQLPWPGVARIGIFRRDDFDPGAYAVAAFHAQQAVAAMDAPERHTLSLHTFRREMLRQVAGKVDVDALLTFGPEGDDLAFLRETSLPSVVCERVVEGLSYVAPDNDDIGRVAAQHLLGLGHRTLAVALPGTPETAGTYHGWRLRGFLQACAAAGCAVPEEDVLYGTKDTAGGVDVATRQHARAALPEAIYMQNLSQMMGLLRAFQERDVRVPEDVSVVATSFSVLNAHEAADYTTPPFTSVTFAKEEMGARGVRHLIDAVEGRTRGPLQLLLPGVLVLRKSTAPALVPA